MPEQTLDSRTWWSRAILIGSVVAAVMLPVGALGTRLGIWQFSGGFLLLAGGAVLAAVGLIVGLVGIIVAVRRKLTADKPAIYIGTLVSALVLALMGMQFATAASVPPIHNISTDVNDPPVFERMVTLRGEGSNPLEYDSERLAPLQQEAYPWVKPLDSELAPIEALRRARGVLEDMGLEIVGVEEDRGLVEATDTTFWFGFKDDVVVRIRAQEDGTGSRVDVRSVSRVGTSDLGVNARRIGEFLTAFAER
jgi:uncharacterized protein (DUF1499 family)